MKNIFSMMLLCCVSCSPGVPTPAPILPPDGWTEENCSECDGKGTVTYDENSWMVVNGGSDPGIFTCPICQGDKKLWVKPLPVGAGSGRFERSIRH